MCPKNAVVMIRVGHMKTEESLSQPNRKAIRERCQRQGGVLGGGHTVTDKYPSSRPPEPRFKN